MTHEVGHYLGLDHSQIQEATMYRSARLGETKKRSLEQDDIDGVCSIYPVSESPLECGAPPYCNPESLAALRNEAGCMTHPKSPKQPLAWLALFTIGLWLRRQQMFTADREN